MPVKLAGPGSAARRRSGWWVVVVAWWGLFATWATDSSGRAQRRVFVGSFEPALLQIAGVTFAACDNLSFKLP